MRFSQTGQDHVKTLQLDLFHVADASGASNTPSPGRFLGRKSRKEFIGDPDWRPFSTCTLPMMAKSAASKSSNPAHGRAHHRA